MEKGTINVQTENIFPIIKKFLYSDHEIFLRELISNAVDATQKMKTLARKGDYKKELGDLTIEVKADEKKKTLTFIDKGIGMTADEVKRYINQIAFSSASEFLEKYKDESAIIGHFGLGFYSAFMVADKVELHTKSYKRGGKAATWICEGTTEFSLTESDKKDRGTEIVLHINDENKEYLKDYKVEELLKKYCKFLPVTIQFGTKEEEVEDEKGKSKKEKRPNIINNTEPAWLKAPSDLAKQDYQDFYKELYPFSEAPLFWIHLNVDYPFKLTGILYFPKLGKSFEVQKNKIQLYSNQVFVTDSVQEIVPEWLTLLHGVIDSPDIPLNVSRSYLQSDPNVKKINSHITKKVAEKLESLFKDDRGEYQGKWEDIGVFVKYGMMSDEKFAGRADKFCIYENVDGRFFTFEEYQENCKAAQTDKDGNFIVLYTNDQQEQDSFIGNARSKEYDVLKMDTMIDDHFINFMEQKKDKTQFKRVDADSIDNLIGKDEKIEPVLTKRDQEKLEKLYNETIDDKSMSVQLKSLSPDDQAVSIIKPEFSRRMKAMSEMSGMGMGNMPEMNNLVVNMNHPVQTKILRSLDEEKKGKMIKQLYDLALLSQNMLKGKSLTDFLKRSVDLVE